MNKYDFNKTRDSLESACTLSDLRIMDCYENADDTIPDYDATPESRIAWIKVFKATIASYEDM